MEWSITSVLRGLHVLKHTRMYVHTYTLYICTYVCMRICPVLGPGTYIQQCISHHIPRMVHMHSTDANIKLCTNINNKYTYAHVHEHTSVCLYIHIAHDAARHNREA